MRFIGLGASGSSWGGFVVFNSLGSKHGLESLGNNKETSLAKLDVGGSVWRWLVVVMGISVGYRDQ
jgi:hypothetical protein